MSPHPGHCTAPSPGRLPQEILTSPGGPRPEDVNRGLTVYSLFCVLQTWPASGSRIVFGCSMTKKWAEPWLIEAEFTSPECTGQLR